MNERMNDGQIFQQFSSCAVLYQWLNDRPDEKVIFIRLVKLFHELKIDWYTTDDQQDSAVFGVKAKGNTHATHRYGRVFTLNNRTIMFKIGKTKKEEKFSQWIIQSIAPVNADLVSVYNQGIPLTQKIINSLEGNININQSEWGVGSGFFPSAYSPPQNENNPEPVHPDEAGEPVSGKSPSILQIYYGPPGTGKTKKLIYTIKNEYQKRFKFVTFHQSYGYEDFVEGLRPVLISDNEKESKIGSIPDKEKELQNSSIQYEIRDGIFKKLCVDARKDPSHRFAMVIDEINRGNISKIFGELITLIEPCKREGGSEEVALTLPYSGESFTVPSNVDIFGSMNTADRSLALLDTALRRRFEFISFYPDPKKLENITVINDEGGANTRIKLSNLLATLNERIEVLYDRDHTIGHGYFFSKIKPGINEIKFSDFRSIFEKNILPLLEEYFFEDREKIRIVLGDSIKGNDNPLIFYKRQEIEWENLFGSAYAKKMEGLDKYQYVKNDAAFSNPAAYIGIYAQG